MNIQKILFYGVGIIAIYFAGVKTGNILTFKILFNKVQQIKMDNNYLYDDILFETLDEASNAISNLREIIKDHGYVTVADLYDLAGLTPEFTYSKIGWKNLPIVKIKRKPNGYYLELPRAVVL